MTDALRPTELRIEAAALKNNLRAVKTRLAPGVKLLAVVKADAYGHGMIDAARVFLSEGADGLCVAIAEEGIALREGGITADILVMGGASEAAARAAVEHGLAQTVYDIPTLAAIQRAAEDFKRIAQIHIKVDTGMTRLGVAGEEDLEALLDRIERCAHVRVAGVYTHFADAAGDDAFTREQYRRFERAVKRVRARGHAPITHASASDAVVFHPECALDAVRPGIMLYGASVPDDQIIPAQTLVTRPVRIQSIDPGDTVSYGREFTAARPTRIMTLPVGYGDGYPRILGGRADVLVRGRRARLTGRVCMDMIMADITDIPEVSMEDEVVVLGAQGDERITPDELARLAQTIPYEIMLGFTPRVRRRFLP